MGDNRIILRAHAAVPDEVTARIVLDAISLIMVRYGKIVVSRAVRYWKIPEYFEVVIEIEPLGKVSAIFHRIVDSLGIGWDVHHFDGGGDWAIWNSSSTSTFGLPEVRWANLECIER